MHSGLGFALLEPTSGRYRLEKGGMRGIRLLSDQALYETVAQCSATEQRVLDSRPVSYLTDPIVATSSRHISNTQHRDLGGRRSTESV